MKSFNLKFYMKLNLSFKKFKNKVHNDSILEIVLFSSKMLHDYSANIFSYQHIMPYWCLFNKYDMWLQNILNFIDYD
jgi:hypothetical protein